MHFSYLKKKKKKIFLTFSTHFVGSLLFVLISFKLEINKVNFLDKFTHAYLLTFNSIFNTNKTKGTWRNYTTSSSHNTELKHLLITNDCRINAVSDRNQPSRIDDSNHDNQHMRATVRNSYSLCFFTLQQTLCEL